MYNLYQQTREPYTRKTCGIYTFAPLSEYGKPNAMQEIASPEFDRLSYAIEDYTGFLPVPNDLLDDTDQALESYLRQ